MRKRAQGHTAGEGVEPVFKPRQTDSQVASQENVLKGGCTQHRERQGCWWRTICVDRNLLVYVALRSFCGSPDKFPSVRCQGLAGGAISVDFILKVMGNP